MSSGEALGILSGGGSSDTEFLFACLRSARISFSRPLAAAGDGVRSRPDLPSPSGVAASPSPSFSSSSFGSPGSSTTCAEGGGRDS